MEPINLADLGHLPAGAIISVPNFALDYNPAESTWSDPKHFDGFRYYKLRRSSPEEHSHHQFSETSLDAMHFGLGRQACPGRFFASNEIKLLLVHLIMNYDISLSDSEKGRPANSYYETQVLADSGYKLNMRKRMPEDLYKPPIV
jgi:cytochrome P450